MRIAWVAQLVEHLPEEEGVAGSIPAPSTLVRLNFQFCLAAFVEFGEADYQKSVFFCRLGFLYFHLLREHYGAGKRAPIQFLKEKVAVGTLGMAFALAADSDHVAGNRYIEVFRPYAGYHRFNNDMRGGLVNVYRKLS